MILEKINVKNFRCIKDETLSCSNLTALVGPNGVGKSTFLRAIELFFKDNISLNKGDFYNCNTEEEIIVSATFANLSTEASALFGKYIQEDKLTVERVFKLEEGRVTWKYHGSLKRCEEFLSIRDALQLKDRGASAKEIYNKLKQENAVFSSLPDWSSMQTAPENMSSWEENNRDKCKLMRDEGQFFGFKQVGNGYLGKYIKPIFIPAVKDASLDANDNSKSPVSEILDLVVRSVIMQKEEVVDFKKRVIAEHKKIMSPELVVGLPDLSGGISQILHNFVSDSDVQLEWKDLRDVDLPMPEADIKILEDGFGSDISHVGHGLQRLFILTLFQYLIKIKTDIENKAIPEEASHNTPDILLIIEEPEIYQHPSRQRHLAKVLMQLSTGEIPGVAASTQVIYCTHSPFFVGIDRINQIRLLKKEENDPEPKCTKIIENKLDNVAKKLWEINGGQGEQYTEASLLPRLKTILTPWINEGFFSNMVVLVEGEDDLAILSGVAKKKGLDFEENGISVIPCNGKNNIDRLYLIFSGFGIPCYVVWDSDYGSADGKPETNKILMKMLGILDDDLEDWPDKCEANYSCFKTNLNSKLKEELGNDLFIELLDKYKKEYGFLKDTHALKNPFVIEGIFNDAYAAGKTAATFERIVDNIFTMRNK